VPLPEAWDPADPSDDLGELLDRDAVSAMLDDLAEGKTKQVMELRHLDRLEIPERSPPGSRWTRTRCTRRSIAATASYARLSPVADPVMQLFEEYVNRFTGGERPDLRLYLERAGESRDELAELVSRFLQWAEAPEPDENAVLVAHAWLEGEAPLVALRAQQGITRDAVVDAVMARFNLAAGLREKVRRRYHELETGQIDPRRADPSLLDELAAIFKARVADLLAWQPRPAAVQTVFHRANQALAAAPQMASESTEPDDVDRLFLGNS
jgi:hypothetical protein